MRLLINEGAGQPAESALEPHVSTSAEAQEGFVLVCDLEVDLPPRRCTVCPHNAAPLPQVRDGVTVRHLVLHALHRSQRGLDGNRLPGLARDNNITSARIRAQFRFYPLALLSLPAAYNMAFVSCV